MFSRNESEHEDDSSVGSHSVEEELISDDDVEAWMETTQYHKNDREKFIGMFRRVKENDPTFTKLDLCGSSDYVETMNYDSWERLGVIIASNSHLTEFRFGVSYGYFHHARNTVCWHHDRIITLLFQGLTRSDSIEDVSLRNHGFGLDGLRSMVPFLQNSNSLWRLELNDNHLRPQGFRLLLHALRYSPVEQLECDNCGLDSFEIEANAFPKELEILTLQDNGFGVDGLRCLVPLLQNSSYLISLDVSGNNITPEGFSLLFWVFRDSPMEELICGCCGLDSIAIDDAFIPTNLKFLYLYGKYGGRIENSIKADGCREVAKLLLGESATLEILELESNEVDDEGVAILVSALQNNTKVNDLRLDENEGITMVGLKLLLKLVNDASSIKSTLQSNHTLRRLGLSCQSKVELRDEAIKKEIEFAVRLNNDNENNPAAAGRKKVIQTQLNSQKRSELCHHLGIGQRKAVLLSEIKPIHLPEVLALISRHHGQGELYAALVPSIAALFSTVNKKQCLQQQKAYHEAKLENIKAEIAVLEEAERLQQKADYHHGTTV